MKVTMMITMMMIKKEKSTTSTFKLGNFLQTDTGPDYLHHTPKHLSLTVVHRAPSCKCDRCQCVLLQCTNPVSCLLLLSPDTDRLVGLVVRRPPQEWKIPGSNPACAGIFSGSNHTSNLKIGTPVGTLPGAWRYRVSAGTGRPGVSIL